MIVGNRVKFSATFFDQNGAVTTPTQPSLVVKLATITKTFTVGGADELHPAGPGEFYAEMLMSAAGACQYKWLSSALGEESADEGSFTVNKPKIT